LSITTDGDAVAINDDGMAWIARLASIRAQKKHWADAEKEAIAAIRALTHGHREIRFHGRAVAYDKEVVSRRLDPKMVRDLYPQVAEACTVESYSQRFELVGGAEDE
jgi:hypothetical protein